MLDMCFATEIDDNGTTPTDYAYEEEGEYHQRLSNVQSTDATDTDVIDLQINDDQVDYNETSKSTPSDESLIGHNRLAHMPIKRIQQLAHRGILP